MDTMPKLVTPEEQPEAVTRFISVWGNSARTTILHFLRTHGPSMRVDIAEATKLAKPTLGHHLAELVDLGIVETDLPPERRRGRSAYYSINNEKMTEMVEAWKKYALGTDTKGI